MLVECHRRWCQQPSVCGADRGAVGAGFLARGWGPSRRGGGRRLTPMRAADGECGSPHSMRSGVSTHSWVESVVTEASLSRRQRRQQVADAAKEAARALSPHTSDAAKTLMVSLALSLTIVVAQTVGALLAHSVALMADTASMVLDTCTYAINLYAELSAASDPTDARHRRVIAAGVSLLALVSVCMYFLYEACTTVVLHGGESIAVRDAVHTELPVSAPIVFGFAVAGLTADAVSLSTFAYYNRRRGWRDGHGGAALNLRSAFMHVAADALRSTATLVEAVLIGCYDMNGPLVDAYITIAVLVTVFVGLLAPLVDWVMEVREVLLDGAASDLAGVQEERATLLCDKQTRPTHIDFGTLA